MSTNILNHRLALLVLLFFAVPIMATAHKHDKNKQRKFERDLPAVMWRDPGDIAALNLFDGAGGSQDAPDPNGTFTFLEEDRVGTSPKFDVEDANGVKWRVKLGEEVQAETAATRLLWAAGYFVDEDYYLPEIKVERLPRLHRGEQYVVGSEIVRNVRLERKPKVEKLGKWSWFKNPFIGTREFNGLRVMMALLNNWDLKNINNSIDVVGGERRYLVSDVGATFGRTGDPFTRSKSDLKGYEESRFVAKERRVDVDFTMHSRPFILGAIDLPNYDKRVLMEEVPRRVPLADAKWLGQLLGQLSERQIRDCFRAAGYSPEQIDGYTREVQKRIAALNSL